MMLIATSAADLASSNILRQILDLGGWRETGHFDDCPVYRREDKLLLTLRDMHLYRDHLDRDVAANLGVKPELIVYASRHRSESGMRSFTVHPIGNFGGAEYGGIPHRLVPTAPHWMTQALRLLKEKASGLEHTVSFEATHHGPYLGTPAFYIEVGSDEAAWREREPARAIAEVLIELRPVENPTAIGIGGGHYVPRITDVALTRRVSFGHIIPSYALEALDESLLKQAIERTPGASMAYVHRKAIKGEARRRAERMLEDRGLATVRERDLESL
ncbi:MAG: D-aminoacyl-tRNA deacylase [Thermoplasmata archaeon]